MGISTHGQGVLGCIKNIKLGKPIEAFIHGLYLQLLAPGSCLEYLPQLLLVIICDQDLKVKGPFSLQSSFSVLLL